VTGVPSELLNPKRSWILGESDFKVEVTKLGKLFNENFQKYSDEATESVIKAGPTIGSTEAGDTASTSAADL
jgi:phosphoenolpyruvate carboxykinase (ATP)